MMARIKRAYVVFFGMLLGGVSLTAQEGSRGDLTERNISLRHEVQRSIDRALTWLESNQEDGGYWSTEDHPAVTGLILTAFQRNPDAKGRISDDEVIEQGYAFLERCVQPDGGIYNKTSLFNYNTAISMMAFLAADKSEYAPIVRKARQFLVNNQIDAGERGKPDHPMDGGMGYGGEGDRADLSNTLFALEAMARSRHLVGDRPRSEVAELDWKAAIRFVENCQNLPEYNEQEWVSGDPQNRGGFVYRPGESKAGEMELDSGRTALRSYGSMSYAGLLSYIYADLERDDPRVEAVHEWLRRNYTLKENPGMGPQGLYYYYHTMAKGLTTYGGDGLELEDGERVNWRKELALKLFDLQRPNGSWINERSGRWWENDPALVTAYIVLALEHVHHGL